jgi:leucyl aminopeptidase
MSISIESTIDNTIPIIAIQTSEYKNYLTNAADATQAWLTATDFRANPHTHALLPDASGRIAQVLVGIRDADDIYAFSHLPLSLPPGRYSITKNESACFSWQLGSYQFTKYKKPKREPATLVVTPSPVVEKSQMIYAAMRLVRDLVNTPTEDMGPQHLSEVAQSLAKEFGATFHEWVGEDLLKHNFPAIHAVGRASHRPPRLIELTWGDAKHTRVAIVGKGVCFDTGGVNLKGADGMRWMKKDMGGGAHALALARLIMAAKLPVHLHAPAKWLLRAPATPSRSAIPMPKAA